MNTSQISGWLIEHDISISLGIINTLSSESDRTKSIYGLCLTGHFSLIAYEALNYRNRQHGLNTHLSTTLEKARHRAKLYEDTSLGVNGVAQLIGKDMQSMHEKEMRKDLISPLLSFLQPDIGLTFANSKLIYTTHGSSYSLGLGDDEALLFDHANARLLGEELGSTLKALVSTPHSFSAKHLLQAANFSDKDRFSKRLYRTVFNGKSSPEINASLLTMQGRVNFAKYCLVDCATDETLLKFKYITLYTALKSLAALKNDFRTDLNADSINHIDLLLRNSDNQLVLSFGGRTFRNTLVHYDIRHFANSDIIANVKMFGLIEKFFPGYNYDLLAALVEASLLDLSDKLNEWSNL